MRVSLLSIVFALAAAIPSVARASFPRGTGPADPYAHAIGEHTTEFEFDRAHAGRAHNVALAASLLDGAILEPGATLSFNDRVGPRTLEAGFAEAPELADGHLHEGVGGGVCQVATTLHIASMHAGLEIVEHRTHSIPLHYADEGLDATVSYGRIDYRVRNPYSFAVRVRAHAENGVLVVRIEGAEALAPATVHAQIVRRLERREVATVDASLPAGTRIVTDRGRDGLILNVRVTRADGTHTDEYVRYPSSDRLVRVSGN
jgi:vancomycin resistance protein YoaR